MFFVEVDEKEKDKREHKIMKIIKFDFTNNNLVSIFSFLGFSQGRRKKREKFRILVSLIIRWGDRRRSECLISVIILYSCACNKRG